MPNKQTEYSVQQLKNLSADFGVSPPIPREGMMGKDADGNWRNVLVTSDGKLDVNTAAPTGGATSANQDTLNALIETLQELSQRLAPLAGAMANTAQLRTLAVVSGTVAVSSAPSTAVTGPLTSAQSIAEKATGGINYTNRIAAINLNAVQSNINNCVGA